MATYSIAQGESVALEIPIFEDNSAVDLSLATDIKVVLYVKNVPGPKFSLTAQTGYGVLTVKIAPDAHIIVLELTRAQTQLMDIGAFYASIVTKENSVDLTDGLVKEYIQLPIGTITYGNFVKDEILA